MPLTAVAAGRWQYQQALRLRQVVQTVVAPLSASRLMPALSVAPLLANPSGSLSVDLESARVTGVTSSRQNLPVHEVRDGELDLVAVLANPSVSFPSERPSKTVSVGSSAPEWPTDKRADFATGRQDTKTGRLGRCEMSPATVRSVGRRLRCASRVTSTGRDRDGRLR